MHTARSRVGELSHQYAQNFTTPFYPQGSIFHCFLLAFCFSTSSLMLPLLSLSPFPHAWFLLDFNLALSSSAPCRLCSPCPWWTRACAPGGPCWSTRWAATPAWEKWTSAETTWTTSGPRCSAKPCRSTRRSGEGNYTERRVVDVCFCCCCCCCFTLFTM